MKIKTKGRGKRVLSQFGERNLVKEKIKNDKNTEVEPSLNRGERENLKKLLKKLLLKKLRSIFKKPDSRCSIDRKTSSINRTRQKLTQIFKQDFN